MRLATQAEAYPCPRRSGGVETELRRTCRPCVPPRRSSMPAARPPRRRGVPHGLAPGHVARVARPTSSKNAAAQGCEYRQVRLCGRPEPPGWQVGPGDLTRLEHAHPRLQVRARSGACGPELREQADGRLRAGDRRQVRVSVQQVRDEESEGFTVGACRSALCGGVRERRPRPPHPPRPRPSSRSRRELVRLADTQHEHVLRLRGRRSGSVRARKSLGSLNSPQLRMRLSG